jgi:hypothetical protein
MNRAYRLVLAACLVVFPISAQAQCASDAAYQALSMRALQSELTVAALACRQKSLYKLFVEENAGPLQAQGDALRAYFIENGGEHGMNKFVTQMANQASRISLETPWEEYCRNSAKLFTTISEKNPEKLLRFATEKYASWHNISSCTRKAVAVK